MSMNKLLSICERFAVEYDVLFNSRKSKLIVYNTRRQGTSGNSIELSFMNGKILQSNSEKHLGNIIGVGCNQKIIDDAVSDFYVRVNMVMSHFSHVASHVRYKLFKTYCMSLYGCQLWDFQSKVTNKFYVAWRKSVRRILGVPYTTHCNLLHYIAEDKDLKVQLYSRFIKFIQTLYNSNNKLSNICVTLALAGSTSHVSNNISTVCSFLNIPRYDVCSNKIYKCHIYNTNPDECEIQANASVVRDMLHMQHMHKVSITKPSLAIDEIALIIENICTK